jgi:hypothetical protein
LWQSIFFSAPTDNHGRFPNVFPDCFQPVIGILDSSFLKTYGDCIPLKMNKPIHLKSSIVGFHNPRKHNGLSPEEFLMLYIKRQSKRAWNTQSTPRALLVIQVLKDWGKWCKKVLDLFPNTLSKK